MEGAGEGAIRPYGASTLHYTTLYMGPLAYTTLHSILGLHKVGDGPGPDQGLIQTVCSVLWTVWGKVCSV